MKVCGHVLPGERERDIIHVMTGKWKEQLSITLDNTQYRNKSQTNIRYLFQ